MTRLHTCAYGALRPGMGLPVVASLGLPKWIPEAATWPRLWLLTPRPAYLRAPDSQQQYLAQIQRYGVQRISRALEHIAREHEAEHLLIMCFETLAPGQDAPRCHRAWWAEWHFAQTGELVTEVT